MQKNVVPAQKQGGGAGGGNAARLANVRLSFVQRAVFSQSPTRRWWLGRGSKCRCHNNS